MTVNVFKSVTKILVSSQATPLDGKVVIQYFAATWRPNHNANVRSLAHKVRKLSPAHVCHSWVLERKRAHFPFLPRFSTLLFLRAPECQWLPPVCALEKHVAGPRADRNDSIYSFLIAITNTQHLHSSPSKGGRERAAAARALGFRNYAHRGKGD